MSQAASCGRTPVTGRTARKPATGQAHTFIPTCSSCCVSSRSADSCGTLAACRDSSPSCTPGAGGQVSSRSVAFAGKALRRKHKCRSQVLPAGLNKQCGHTAQHAAPSPPGRPPPAPPCAPPPAQRCAPPAGAAPRHAPLSDRHSGPRSRGGEQTKWRGYKHVQRRLGAGAAGGSGCMRQHVNRECSRAPGSNRNGWLLKPNWLAAHLLGDVDGRGGLHPRHPLLQGRGRAGHDHPALKASSTTRQHASFPSPLVFPAALSVSLPQSVSHQPHTCSSAASRAASSRPRRAASSCSCATSTSCACRRAVASAALRAWAAASAAACAARSSSCSSPFLVLRLQGEAEFRK